jgi:molybdopterin synthase sulfur carrier subunit
MARLLYFAALAERVGKTSEDTELPAAVTTVGALVAWLRARGPSWEKALDPATLNVTVNRQFATPESPVDNRAEIGLISTRPR